MKNLANYFKAALYESCPAEDIKVIENSYSFQQALDMAYSDLVSFSKKDPAANMDLEFICRTYTSYSAVLHYRLAHSLFKDCIKLDFKKRVLYAGIISQRGKLKSGAEIHFKANIGHRFILDHGYGTVIGETCKIGSDCYLLGGVILGARGISGNPNAPRHPIIGNNVQIGAFSSVLGNISIGDSVFIGPNCTVTTDVPANSKVINNDYLI